jgi:hypothetical protein
MADPDQPSAADPPPIGGESKILPEVSEWIEAGKHSEGTGIEAAKSSQGRIVLLDGDPRDPASDNVAVDQRLSAIAAQALAGHHVESAWELFRLQHFPGWEQQEIAAVLGVWSHRHGIELTFEGRTVQDLQVTWVCFRRR